MAAIEIDAELPAAALINGPSHRLEDTIRHADGLWLHGDDGRFDCDAEGAVTAWRPRVGHVSAVPTQPNTGNTRLDRFGDASGLQTRQGIHCGFVAENVAQDVRAFSMAVIYRPDPVEKPRTLLTLNPRPGGGGTHSGGYLFVSDLDDGLTVKDTGEALSITAPADPAPRAAHLLVVTVAGNALAVQHNGGPLHQVTGLPPRLDGEADLFIGARSHRNGLQKTLGQALYLDVFFWPTSRLLLPATDDDISQRAALMQYYHWVYGS